MKFLNRPGGSHKGEAQILSVYMYIYLLTLVSQIIIFNIKAHLHTRSSRWHTQVTLKHASNQVKVWTRIPRYNIIRGGSQRVYCCIFQIARYICIYRCDRLFRAIHTLSSRWHTQVTLRSHSNIFQTAVKFRVSEPIYIYM